ncbi:MAG: tetratricopeptide repeat protein [Polyangiaceae bacterium]|nr:tetratricopeptide repeat protein [Polyangiaceae bacterium]
MSEPPRDSAPPETGAENPPDASGDAISDAPGDAASLAETPAITAEEPAVVHDTEEPPAEEIEEPAPPPPPAAQPFYARAADKIRGYFLDEDPSFWSALAPFVLLSIILFSRSPATNYIFDEQEALLANPYVNATGGLRFIDAIHRDFWGLPPDRSVGSYRPLPNFLWRALWGISKQPFFHHIYNVVFHAVNGALLTCIAFALTRRRGTSYLAGLLFVTCAVLTEAVSGIVGIADVLGGMGALLAIYALFLPAWAMPFGVFIAVSLGLFSKESALVCVPLIPFAALVAAPLTHPERPSRVLRALLALIAAAGAFVVYVELRKRWFPAPLAAELRVDLPPDTHWTKRFAHEFLRWFHQAPLPRDPLNNPLADAPTPLRIAGALRVYWRGLVQIVFPKTLSGDYSFPQEPAPTQPYFFESIAGAAMMVLPLLASVGLWVSSMVMTARARASQMASSVIGQGARHGLLITGLIFILISLIAPAVDLFYLRPRGIRITLKGLPWYLPLVVPLLVGIGLVAESRDKLPRPDAPNAPVPLARAGAILAAVGLTWVVISYFPHSNIPTVLPTVRAERFWYFPAIGSSLVLAAVFSWLHHSLKNTPIPYTAGILIAAFFGFQSVQAYRHAMDYRNDLVFWEGTKNAVPLSAKAHLNYSVMAGARGDMETRLRESRIAIQLAPKWPMAHVYTGDTLCRMHRAEEAWPYYKEGFDIGPNEMSLIALALQCLYDEKQLYAHEDELRELAKKHPDSWIAYLANDTLTHSETHKGVDPKYRPRGYNEGPKE